MAENAFIGDEVIAQACCPTSLSADQPYPGLWLGGSDEQTEGLWVWEDDQTPFWMGRYNYGTMENGAAIDGHFASWGVHQPDSGFDQEEDCLRTTGLLWNDQPVRSRSGTRSVESSASSTVRWPGLHLRAATNPITS